ncbi:MAG: S49 family peptidase [Myxococcales bacterium]|nr:S49 family peptidase [Myxococcales bacterium]
MTHAFATSLRRDPWYLGEIDHGELLKSIDASELDVSAFLGSEEEELKAPSLLQVEDGIATVAVHGPLATKVHPMISALYGVSDMNLIQDALVEASLRDDVKGVLLDIDSPGGTVRGTPETSAMVGAVACSKPVYAFTDSMMASAAYYIGSQADAIYTTQSATIGSIGVMLPHVDMSEKAKAQGLKVRVFTSGKFKAAGYPGTSLTEEQAEQIQEGIDEMFSDFRAAVLRRGRAISDETMQGQTFTGSKGVELNVATDLVSGKAEAIQRLKRLISLRG